MNKVLRGTAELRKTIGCGRPSLLLLGHEDSRRQGNGSDSTSGGKVAGKKTGVHYGLRKAVFNKKNWGDRPDSNRRPPAPQAGALTN